MAFVSDNPTKYENLTPRVKEMALDKFREHNLDYEWWEYVYENAKAIGALMGIEIDEINFSGFCSQGDGASFTGSYKYAKGSVKAVKEYAPEDERLHSIAEQLASIQRRNFYGLTAELSRNDNRYSHENTVTIDSYFENSIIRVDCLPGTDKEVGEILKSFMKWIYKQLETEYEYLQSDEVLKEGFEANEYQFDGDNGQLV